MSSPAPSRLVCLSNVYDEQYEGVRAGLARAPMTSPKRATLFKCLQAAMETSLLVLSSPPRSVKASGSSTWLKPVTSRFSDFPQFVCSGLTIPKVRVPFSWIAYALHVLRHTRTGDIIVIDNYEFIYILAARLTRLIRSVTFILDYEDGKHQIDKGGDRVLSGIAEWLGRGLISGAILVHPDMRNRLSPNIPTILVPGFLTSRRPSTWSERQSKPCQLLYSGSLDTARGVDLLLTALMVLPPNGWHLHITGEGPLEQNVRTIAGAAGEHRITFHGRLSPEQFTGLILRCDVGLNCQRVSDPISGVTFPSKVFTYLSAGLHVISSRAGAVTEVCGRSVQYYDGDFPEALASAIHLAMQDVDPSSAASFDDPILQRYSVEGTIVRLRGFFRLLSLSH